MASNVGSGSGTKTSKKRSVIWKYFTINSVDEAYVNCNTCSLKISRGGKDPRSYGTSALTTHLRTKHTAVFIEYGKEMAQSELERARKRSPDDDDSGSQPKLIIPESGSGTGSGGFRIRKSGSG